MQFMSSTKDNPKKVNFMAIFTRVIRMLLLYFDLLQNHHQANFKVYRERDLNTGDLFK